MKKLQKNESGFSAVEVLLAILILVVIGGIGYMVYHNNHKTVGATNAASTTSIKSTSTSSTPTKHTAQAAVAFVQSTYATYLDKVNNAPSDNTQPLGLYGLSYVQPDLTPSFYSQAANSRNGSDFSCAAQFVPSGYTASLGSSNNTITTVNVTISNSSDGSINTSGMVVNVNLASLKITSVTCPGGNNETSQSEDE
jgi:hypothetical protein